jgi:hypothetical protein
MPEALPRLLYAAGSSPFAARQSGWAWRLGLIQAAPGEGHEIIEDRLGESGRSRRHIRRPTRRTPAAASSAARITRIVVESVGAGACPWALHVPALPDRLQTSPTPVHAWLQHTPCAQNPDPHCDGLVQLSPRPRLLGVAVDVGVRVAVAVGVEIGVPVAVAVDVGVLLAVFV